MMLPQNTQRVFLAVGHTDMSLQTINLMVWNSEVFGGQ